MGEPTTRHPAELWISRREFLALCAAAAAAGRAGAQTAALDDFPDVPVYRADYVNWSQEMRFSSLLTCAPRTAQEVADLANWAAAHGFRLRPRGCMHGWSPLSLAFSTTAATPVVMVDTTVYLNAMALADGPVPAVRVGSGATMDALLAWLEARGLGFGSTPAPGDITVGGALAINAHGAAAPAVGESGTPARVFGSMSNRILALEAVVWSPAQNAYVPRRFDRASVEAGALATHLGRAFVTEATLAAEPNPFLRCVSHVDIPASELFAAPGSGAQRTLAHFVDASGRVEAIWYPFTTHPWLKVWSLSPTRPLTSRPVSQPYNYPFSDQVPVQVSDLATSLLTGNGAATPLFGNTEYSVTASGLLATAAADLWGPSKNVLLYVRPTTLRAHDTGFVVLTGRAQLQRVVADFSAYYRDLLASYAARGSYPTNVAMEIRVNGLDRPDDLGAGARPPLLSGLAPRPERPDWDTVVWLSVLALPGTPDIFVFRRELERWAIGHFDGGWALFRPEWSKGWAYRDEASWDDDDVLGRVIPAAFGAGWNSARSLLQALDPKRVFGNAFTDRLFG